VSFMAGASSGNAGSLGITAKTMGLNYTLHMNLEGGFCEKCEIHNLAYDMGSQFLLHSSNAVAVSFREQYHLERLEPVPAHEWLQSCLEKLEVSNVEKFRSVMVPALQWAIDLCIADAEEDAGKLLEQMKK